MPVTTLQPGLFSVLNGLPYHAADDFAASRRKEPHYAEQHPLMHFHQVYLLICRSGAGQADVVFVSPMQTTAFWSPANRPLRRGQQTELMVTRQGDREGWTRRRMLSFVRDGKAPAGNSAAHMGVLVRSDRTFGWNLSGTNGPYRDLTVRGLSGWVFKTSPPDALLRLDPCGGKRRRNGQAQYNAAATPDGLRNVPWLHRGNGVRWHDVIDGRCGSWGHARLSNTPSAPIGVMREDQASLVLGRTRMAPYLTFAFLAFEPGVLQIGATKTRATTKVSFYPFVLNKRLKEPFAGGKIVAFS
ncbi:hypothetical protein BDW22DRAFT_1420089 [Trametopsis cervina]|nr:hypothetical protein BDW22DRAFT_1420089 [Trametopsis cervina]